MTKTKTLHTPGGRARAQDLIPVKVTTALRLANYTPAYTAVREGIFEKHGLDVEISSARRRIRHDRHGHGRQFRH